MKFTSTRSNVEADSLYTVLRGLAPDGGLYVPKSVKALDPSAIASIKSLADAERLALGAIFDDIPAEVREDAIANLLAKFPGKMSCGHTDHLRQAGERQILGKMVVNMLFDLVDEV